MSGPFYIIQDFKNFHESLGRPLAGGPHKELLIEPDDDLYTNDIVLQYYNKSNNVPLPGKGQGEKIKRKYVNSLSQLASIKDWRKKLDNLWSGHILIIDGKHWSSVENYYQAMKFKNTDSELYNSFSLDSKSDISKKPVLARKEGERIFNKAKIDKFFKKDNRDLKFLAKALNIKFTQHDDLRQLLHATQNAKLQNYVPNSNPQVCEILMKIRKTIK